MSVEHFTIAQLQEFLTEQWGEFPEEVWDQINVWFERGDGVAIYENVDLGHYNLGQMKFASFGSLDGTMLTFFVLISLIRSISTREPTESVRQWLNIAEAAEYLNTPERFIRRMIETKRVPFHHFGKYVRFNRADLDAFARSGRIEAR